MLSAVVVTLTAVFGMVITAASPAQALSPCTSYSHTQNRGGYMASVPTIGNETDNVNCELWQGRTGDAVKVLQYALNECYLKAFPHHKVPLIVDGGFGTKTREALEFAQYVQGISVDGRYGPQTRTNMLWPQDGGSTATCTYLW
ncbi:hypothetical protein GCM10028775_74560 [Catellatospora paridis]